MWSNKLQVLAFSLAFLMCFSISAQASKPSKYMPVFPFGADDFIMYALTFMPYITFPSLNVTVLNVINTTVVNINVTNNMTVQDTVTAKYFNGSWNGSVARSATLIVCASDSKDKTNCDYLCNGTEDQVVINNAIADLPATGGLIKLMDGTFNISDSITIDVDDTAIIGVGKSTKIQTDNNIIMIHAVSLSGILIKNLYLYGAGASHTSNSCIQPAACDESKIVGNWIENCGRFGIYLQSTFNSIVANNHVIDSKAEGIYLSSATYNVVSNNYAKGNYANIWLGSNSDNNVVADNICIEASSFHGIELTQSDK